MITLSNGTKVDIIMEAKYRQRQAVIPNTITVDNREVPVAWAEGIVRVEIVGKTYEGERVVILAPIMGE